MIISNSWSCCVLKALTQVKHSEQSKYLLACEVLIISSCRVYLQTLIFVTHMTKLSEDKNLISVTYRLKGGGESIKLNQGANEAS